MSWLTPLATGQEASTVKKRNVKGKAAEGGSTTPPLDPESATSPRTPATPFGNFPMNDTYPKVADPSGVVHGGMVSTKQSNRPFLAYKNYRDKLDGEHEAWVQRQKEREEKIKRGEPVGPPEADPTEEQEVGLVGLLKLLATLLVFGLLAGKFFTGSYTWNYEANIKRFWPTQDTYFSEKSLAKFNGASPDRPIFLAIDGLVYDVSSNPRVYGKGGSYNHFTGKDAARAFVTGCFREHQTHDIRGFDEKQMASLDHWRNFFANSKKYKRVGRVHHDPIDPNSPIPPMCDLNNPAPADSGPVIGPQPAPVSAAAPPEAEAKHTEL